MVLVAESRHPLCDVGEGLLLSGPGVRVCGLDWQASGASPPRDAAVTLCVRRAAKGSLLYGAGGLRLASRGGSDILVRLVKGAQSSLRSKSCCRG